MIMKRILFYFLFMCHKLRPKKTYYFYFMFQKLMLKRDYNKNGTHPSGMWGSQESLNPKFQSLCSKNGAAQAPTPPRNDEFSIKWHITENSSFRGGVGACAAPFFEQRL